ncbi:MAG TPA: hypothetical protein VGR59_11445, partial [Gemmatimonadaceae bacterium]|nr:hypothetical protein [Gemmatimonadaceae bacterium]
MTTFHPGCTTFRCRPATLAVALFAVALVASATGAAAQVGTTTDILTGTVTDPTGHPIEGADVEAMSLETEI